MGLIRKQAGFDLKEKIEKWIEESTLGLHFVRNFERLTYDDPDDYIILGDDLKLRVGRWIENQVFESIIWLEIPEYVVFEFGESSWRHFLYNTPTKDPDELCDVFNNKKLNIINVRRIVVPHHFTLSGTSTFDVYDLIDGDWVITRHKLSQNEDWD
jgi:hypothetical protein